MMFDSWAHQFCLACDKQVQADNQAYCSEACRLAEFEKTSSTPSSQASSPGFSPASLSPWTPALSRPTNTKFYLSPAYDFSNAQPYGSTPSQTSYFNNYTLSGAEKNNSSMPPRNLSPSSSHSSLCSMQSSASVGDTNQLSDKARKELQAYAVSFEQVRMQRRRSY